jgi:hypothetical protein
MKRTHGKRIGAPRKRTRTLQYSSRGELLNSMIQRGHIHEPTNLSMQTSPYTLGSVGKDQESDTLFQPATADTSDKVAKMQAKRKEMEEHKQRIKDTTDTINKYANKSGKLNAAGQELQDKIIDFGVTTYEEAKKLWNKWF